MKSQISIIRKYGVWLLDMFCVYISFIIAAHLRFNDLTTRNDTFINIMLIVMILFVTIFNFSIHRNRGFMRRDFLQELKLVVIYNFYLFACLVISAYLMHRSDLLARMFLVYFLSINIVMMMTLRTLTKVFVRKWFGREAFQKMILMIIEKGFEDETFKEFYPGVTYKVDGVLTLDGQHVEGTYHHDPIACDLSDLTSNLVQYQIDDVFIKTPDIPFENIRELIDNFEDMGADCHYAIDVPEGDGSLVSLGTFGDTYAVTYSLYHYKPVALLIKRFIDIIGALVGLAFTGIIAIFLVPAIKLTSPGPAIYSSIRIGRNGRRFKFYKFRSMYIDADERKEELMEQNQMNGLMFKMDNDPRITKVGKFIRKTSLDEFPQFFNVLKGDMSLVGTRPPTEDEFAHYNEHYKRRLSMRPGITGLWQVSGRSDITDFDEVVKLDLEYIDNWSLGKDVRILFKTVAVVFKHKGAE